MARTTGAPRGGVTVGQHSFAQVPSANIQRSSFNRSCGLKTTFDEGNLVPVFVDEALPGDTFSLRMQTFARMSTPLHPIMENLVMDFFFFAVPIRLIWQNWEKMNGAQTDPGDSTDFLVPQMTAPGGGYVDESLSDYLGLPTGVVFSHSSLWHRAYNLIWNEWFRDENLQDSVVVDKDDGPDSPADYVVLKRGKRHDYFTSCLPFPQKGPAVLLPLGDQAPLAGGPLGISATGDKTPLFDAGSTTAQRLQADNLSSGPMKLQLPADASGTGNIDVLWNNPKLQADLGSAYADLSAATAATINELRESFQIQRMFERDARGGTRYTEILRSHFGVISPDQRLQRPEFLGGGSASININPVAATAGFGDQPLGLLGAFGTSVSSGNGFTKSFVEHCVILGLVSVRADLNYQQGVERMFSRRTRFDFYWPSLANLGEQAVLNKEIFVQGTSEDSEVFGYQERFAEYRYKPSRVTGKMRSSSPVTLDTWHLAQDFADLPLLNSTFVQEDAPLERVLAVLDEPHFLLDAYFELKCARPMPVFSVPGLIDHF